MSCVPSLLANVNPATLKSWLEIVGLLLGTAFIAWKICVGWFAANLSLSISSERVAKDERNDFLALTVTLDKGTTDSVYLKDVSLRLTVDGEKERSDRINGFERLPTEGDRLRWPTAGRASEAIAPEHLLAQGESLQLAEVYQVPSHLPATVEVAVLAQRAFYRPFQWRAVHISLPRSDRKEVKP
ncbi:hypothetical protein PROAA_910022 [Candidatus Propionivibrio aalborgensis]|uniref:Uncharacterized protein n=1 Tax=Candidatus Propionivibrio aalborgensis TaxID=1860101 RepID=A0A1A8Y2H3_9RHOO|nr:hypothetical protein [Candidatus Propionivibrio aalborgensis]SBT11161.1 hypothetical protein PROAA_910022 [Candidatus Propionivibrio aalborgensis]